VIRDAAECDAAAVAAIYNHYILNSVISFEEEALSTQAMSQRIAAVQQASPHWLLLEEAGEVQGYAYSSPWNSRAAYRFSAEVSVYLSHTLTPRGPGTRLYTELFARLRAQGMHAVIAGIALPNDASVALHEKFGMQKVAHFSQVGRKFGQWVDVAYWQLGLESAGPGED